MSQSIQVKYDDGKTAEVVVEPMPVARYEKALAMFNERKRDWFALCDLVCNQSPGWSKRLSPESFAEVRDAVHATQQSFFGFAAEDAAWQRALASAGSSTSQT